MTGCLARIRTYNSLPEHEAVTQDDAHLDAHNPDFSSHQLSHADNGGRVEDISEAVEDEERRRVLALTDVTEQNSEKSCLARIRT